MRIALVLAGVAGLAGCDAVYGLGGRTVDGAVIADAPIDQAIDAQEATCPKDPMRVDDEDDDDFPNSCDNCPHVAQIDQTDADGDGVGDACDPRPGAIDRIDYFDGFDSIPLGLELIPATAWKIENGRLVAFDIAQPSDAMARLRHAVGDAQIITRMTLLVSNGDPESAGLWARLGDPDPPTTPSYPPGVLFEVLRNTAGTIRRCHIFETWQAVAPAVDCAQNPQLFQTNQPYTLSLDCIEGAPPECHGVIAFGAGSSHTEIPMEWQSATRAMGAAGLRVYSVDTAFDYVVVIRHD